MRKVRFPFRFCNFFSAIIPVTTPQLQIPTIAKWPGCGPGDEDPIEFIRAMKQYEFRIYEQDRLMLLLEELCRKIVSQSADEIDLKHSKKIKEHTLAILTPAFKLRNKNYDDQVLKDRLNTLAQQSGEIIRSLPEAKKQGVDFETFKATCELLDYMLTTDLFKNSVEKGIGPRP